MYALTATQMERVSGGVVNAVLGAFETVMKDVSVGVAGAVGTVVGGPVVGIIAGAVVDAADNYVISQANSMMQ